MSMSKKWMVWLYSRCLYLWCWLFLTLFVYGCRLPRWLNSKCYFWSLQAWFYVHTGELEELTGKRTERHVYTCTKRVGGGIPTSLSWKKCTLKGGQTTDGVKFSVIHEGGWNTASQSFPSPSTISTHILCTPTQRELYIDGTPSLYTTHLFLCYCSFLF